MSKKTLGFTLIELLVVISIISLLSSVVLSSLNSARNKAKIATSQMQLKQIVQAIIIAQGESGKPLIGFAPSTNCMHCDPTCVVPPSGPNTWNSPGCLTLFNKVLTEIENATNGIVKGLSNIKSDPWGYAYGFDANQGEDLSGSQTTAQRCANIDSFESKAPGITIPNFPTIPLSPSCQ